MAGVLYLLSWTISINAKLDQCSALVKDKNETFCNKCLYKSQIYRPEVPSRGEYTSCWTSMKGNKYLVSIALESQLNVAQIMSVEGLSFFFSYTLFFYMSFKSFLWRTFFSIFFFFFFCNV